MPRVPELPNLRDLVRRYKSGAPLGKLARESGVSHGTLLRQFVGRSVPIRRKTATHVLGENAAAVLASHDAGETATAIASRFGVSVQATIDFLRRNDRTTARPTVDVRRGFDAASVVKRYLAGDSEKALAGDLGVARSVVRRMLESHGINPRGRAAAERLKWHRLKRDRPAVERQCAGAWKASQGRTKSLDELTRSARTRATRLSRIAPDEHALARELRSRGILVRQQHAIGKYNADLVLHEAGVAVEVQRGEINRHPDSGRSTSLAAKRIEYILDAGWSLLIVYVSPKKVLGVPAAADAVIAFANLRGADPSLVGQYGVVGRDGQPTTPRGFYFNSRPRVRGF